MKTVVGHAQARPRPVPRARGVRRLRLRARQGVGQAQLDRGYRLTELLKQGLNSPDAGRGAGRRRSSPAPAATSTTSPSTTCAASRASCSSGSAPATASCSTASRPPATSPTWTPSRRALKAFADAVPGQRRQRRRRRRGPGRRQPTVVAADAALPEDDESTAEERASPWQVVRSAILRRRIKTVQSTKKITTAMELIAATRIVKAQQRVAAARPYSEQITEVIRNLAAAGAGARPPAARAARGRSTRSAFVVVAADRGLAGGYNTTVIRAAERDDARRPQAEGQQTTLVTVGKKAAELLPLPRLRRSTTAFLGFTDAARPTRTPARSPRPSPSAFEAGEYDPVELVYTAVHLAPASQRGRRPPLPAARDRRARRRRAAERPAGRLRVRAVARRDPRAAAAPLRRGPALRRPARRRRRRSTPPASGP